MSVALTDQGPKQWLWDGSGTRVALGWVRDESSGSGMATVS